MRMQFLGSGDAFGSGGRFNSCILLETESIRYLLDCGASSLIAMKCRHVDPNSISTILVTHLHADHFGGLPFFLLDAQFARRRSPLTIVGPPGLRERLTQAMEIGFPGLSATVRKFDLTLLEWAPRQLTSLDSMTVTPYEVCHGGMVQSFALRAEVEGSIISYSGDTEWCTGLEEAARDADLFICEGYSYDKPIKAHLDLATLEAHLPAIRTRRLVLTHMSPDMLARTSSLGYEFAEDGKVIEV